jgi:hypothetical protein
MITKVQGRTRVPSREMIRDQIVSAPPLSASILPRIVPRLMIIANDFDRLERPAFGRYAKQPAIADESGIVMLPPDPLPALLAGAGAMAAAGALVWMVNKRSHQSPVPSHQ